MKSIHTVPAVCFGLALVCYSASSPSASAGLFILGGVFEVIGLMTLATSEYPRAQTESPADDRDRVASSGPTDSSTDQDTLVSFVEIVDWRPGFQKVACNDLLRQHAGLGLAAAKAVTDAVLDGRSQVVRVASLAGAHALASALNGIGANAHVAGSR